MTERTPGPLGFEVDAHAALRQELANDLVTHLCGFGRASRLYDLNNDAVRNSLSQIVATAQRHGQALGDGMRLALIGHTLFLNRRLVRLDLNQYRKVQQLGVIWRQFEIGEMELPPDVSLAGLTELAARLYQAAADPAAVPGLFLKPWGRVTLRRTAGEGVLTERRSAGEYCVRVYCALAVLTRRMLEDLRTGRRPPMLRIKRTLQVLVDQLEGFTHIFLAMMRRPEHRRGLASHLTNSAVLSLVLGRRLGLSRTEMVALATAALFHDLPKLGLNDGALNAIEQPGSLSAADRARVAERWLISLQRIVERSGISGEVLARLVGIYESQLEFTRRDLYGAAERGRSLSLLSRVISICSMLDTITGPRQGKAPRTEHWAMMSILSAAGHHFDAALVRLLLEEVGLYPVGSLVLLDSGEVAVVKEPGRDGRDEQPVVELVLDAGGTPVEGPEIDLAQDPARRVVAPVDGAAVDINVVGVFATADRQGGW